MGGTDGFLSNWLSPFKREPGEYPKRITDASGQRSWMALDPAHEKLVREQWAAEDAARR